eukprot:jgi/Botrbrau1/13955/Bobra.250_1s0009.1
MNTKNRDMWEDRGGLSAALAAIRSGSPETALDAARALHALANDANAAQDLAREGTVRALLRVFDNPALDQDEAAVLNETLIYIIQNNPAMCTQLVAAYADPDPRIAFAAASVSKSAIEDDVSSASLVGAGVAPALVALLSHASPFCRSAAALAIPSALKAPVTARALQRAGLVPAMMRILREGSPRERPPAIGPGAFTAWDFQIPPIAHETDLPVLADPCCCVWPAALGIITHTSGLGREFAQTKDAAEVFVDAIRRMPQARKIIPARVLSRILVDLKGIPQMVSFSSALMSAGFPGAIASLIRPDDKDSSHYAMNTILQVHGFSQANVKPVGAALVRYIEADGNDIETAICALSRLSLLCKQKPEVFVKATLGKDPPKLVENLARFMVKGTPFESLQAYVLLLDYIQWADGEVLLPIAVKAGFIPGILRLCREGRGPTPDVHSMNLVWEGLFQLLRSGKKQYIMLALRHGLLAELDFALHSNKHSLQTAGGRAVRVLLAFPEAVEQMREANLWPAALLDLADSTDANLLLYLVGCIFEIKDAQPHLASEVLSAGALERLQASRARVQGMDRKTKGRLDAALDKLTLLHSMINSGRDAVGNQRGGRAARKGGLKTRPGKAAGPTSKVGPFQETQQSPGDPSGAEAAEEALDPAADPVVAAVEAVRERAFNEADTWRARGGVAAAMRTIRSGSHAKALEAALVLEHLAGDDDAPRELARKGTLRALLLVFTHSSLESCEFAALQCTLDRVMRESPAAPAQLVAAFADSDAQVAFAAAAFSKTFLADRTLGPSLLAAGATRAVVAMLSHSSPYCRSAAALAASDPGDSPELLEALREAGLVPAMMEVLHKTRSRRQVAPPAPGIFAHCRAPVGDLHRHLVHLSLAEPHAAVCAALHGLLAADQRLAGEVAAFTHCAESLVWCLSDCPVDDVAAPAQLLAALLRQLQDKPPGEAFLKQLLSQELFLPSVAAILEQHSDALMPLGLDILESVVRTPGDHLPVLPSVERFMFALVRYVERDGPHIARVAAAINRLPGPNNGSQWQHLVMSKGAEARRSAVHEPRP